jgi:hypothetical protein
MKKLAILLALALSGAASAADVKISALPAASTLAGGEVVPGVQSAATVKITATQIKTFTSASPTLVTPNIGVASGTSLNVSDTATPYQIGGNVVLRTPLDTNSQYQTFVGVDAAKNSTTAAIIATCVGYRSCGGSSTGMTGVENTFVGWNAGALCTTCAFNMGIGVNAMGALITGQNNVAVGMDAIRNSDGITDVVAIGANAHQRNNGNSNVAIGARAMIVGLSGSPTGAANRNIAIGADVMQSASMTDADNNVFVGFEAGKVMTTGDTNIGIGYRAGFSLTTGASNVFIGGSAGQGASGSNNTAVGQNAFGANSNNSVEDTCIGYQSCQNKTSGFDMTALGYQSARNVTGANNNTILGAKTATTLTTGNGNVIIGTSVDVPASNTTNMINIGAALIGYATAPTATSGFGTGPTVTGASTFAFRVTVGTGGGSTTTVVTFGTAPTGWNCTAQDMTTAVTARQSASSTTTATHTWSVAPSASDVLLYQCAAL